MNLITRLRRFSPGVTHYLFAGAFLLRLLGLVRLSWSPLFLPVRGDMHFYNEWARRIMHGELDLNAAFYGLPLYPYFLALVYRIFGYNPFIPALLQALADAGTAVLIYSLTTHLLKKEEENRTPTATIVFGLAAAIGWAFFVPAQAYSIVLMPTAWLVLIFWFVVWRLVKTPRAAGWKECLGLGFLIGFSAMAIATVLFLIPLILTAVFFKSSASIRVRCVNAMILLAAVGLGTAPCWIHNYVIARDPAFLSAHGGVNFWIGNNPRANGYPRFPPGLRAGQAAMLEDSITSAEAAAGRSLKRAEVSAYWSAKANDYIASHKLAWIGLLMRKARNFWNAFQYDDLSIITNLRDQGIILPGLYFGVVAALGIPGALLGWLRAPASRWITAAMILHMVALMSVFITERYRLPVVPGLLIMASYGFWNLWRQLLDGMYARSLVYAALVIGCTAFVSWPQRDPSLWALDAYNSGWQALEIGNLPLAENKLTLARRYVPGNAETNFAFGNLRREQGDNRSAAAFYLHTLQLDEQHRGALNNLAVLALEQNRYDPAETWLRRLEQIDPRNAKTHFLLAKTLLGKGDRDGAHREAILATTLQPGQPDFVRLNEELGHSRD